MPQCETDNWRLLLLITAGFCAYAGADASGQGRRFWVFVFTAMCWLLFVLYLRLMTRHFAVT